MKEKVKYTITIVISIAIGVIGTLLTLNYCGLFDTKVLEKTIRTVSLSEKDTLKESIDKVYEQATEYNHSKTRELAFLVAHSMLHLSGYDHMEDDERRVMEEMQEKILTMKGYTRDYEEN